MHTSKKPGKSPGTQTYPLSVLRFQDAEHKVIWMLSPNIGGLLTHYVGTRKQGRSQYCRGESQCPAAWHKLETHWKGYVSCRVYCPATLLWYPFVLEITECLGLDFRHVYQRGQIWDVGKVADMKGKYAGLAGKLLDTIPPEKAPRPDDIIPVLKWMYHVQSLDLTSENLMPDKVMVQGEAGPIITSLPKAQETQALLDEQRSIDARRADAERIRQAEIQARAKAQAAKSEPLDDEVQRKMQEFLERTGRGKMPVNGNH